LFTHDFQERLTIARHRVLQTLVRERDPGGFWNGYLSPSALSTATALVALKLHAVSEKRDRGPSHFDSTSVDQGRSWLVRTQNADGGWGDTPESLSNISTTVLVWAASALVGDFPPATLSRAESWLLAHVAGGLDPAHVAESILQRYGRDRTFSVPILTMCALCGRLGSGSGAWKHVIALPFELSVLPRQFFASLNLPVVSYALPALISMGLAKHTNDRSRNFLAANVRELCTGKALNVLDRIQPSNGGFLEAVPLTSFVAMSLISAGKSECAVVKKGIDFLRKSQRPDGSWPIDTNLGTWVTTLAIQAMATDSDFSMEQFPNRAALVGWLLQQQHREVHDYTGARPGGWAWTNLPGGMPDADDTSGSLVALRAVAEPTPELIRNNVIPALEWLAGLQNSDGGIPTFCKGWGHLPFDRSSPDITGHALMAWDAWCDLLPEKQQRKFVKVFHRAASFLQKSQTPEGAWIPLWFGNEHAKGETNPVYGTSKVIPALAQAVKRIPAIRSSCSKSLQLGMACLLRLQKADGSWGGDSEAPSSIEETALGLSALIDGAPFSQEPTGILGSKIEKAASWLCDRVESPYRPSPIGFYFANLWYWERLYPTIFTLAALNKTERFFGDRQNR